MSDTTAELESLRSRAATIRRQLDGIERRIAALDPDARPRQLTDEYVRNVTRAGIHSDNRNGLRLRVVRSAKHGTISKQWVQRLQVDGKRTDRGLGGFPVVSLNEAREIASRNVIAARATNALNAQVEGPKAPTFAKAVDIVLQLKSAAWQDGRDGAQAKQWYSSIRDYAIPVMGQMSVAEITEQHVRKALEPIWVVKNPTAEGVQNRISAIMQWAVANGYRQDNPAGPAILNALPKIDGKGKAGLREALHYSKVANAIRTIRESRSSETLKLLFEFLVLTVGRESEALGARWSEIDMDSRTWTIPAERMSYGREHSVPLSDRAVEILIEAKAASKSTDIVFLSRTGRAYRRGSIVKTLRDRGIESTTRGFRYRFKDWATECTDAPRALVEACLAQGNAATLERAYSYLNLLRARRDLMQGWSDYLSK